MSKTFDELFEDFFKRNNIKPEDKIGDGIKDEAKKMMDMLINFKDVEDINEAVEKEIDATLGVPDKIESYNEGNIFFEKRIWHTPTGDLVKIIVSDDPSLRIAPVQPKNLEKQLEEAVAGEHFEKAAAIRDEINKLKKK